MASVLIWPACQSVSLAEPTPCDASAAVDSCKQWISAVGDDEGRRSREAAGWLDTLENAAKCDPASESSLSARSLAVDCALWASERGRALSLLEGGMTILGKRDPARWRTWLMEYIGAMTLPTGDVFTPSPEFGINAASIALDMRREQDRLHAPTPFFTAEDCLRLRDTSAKIHAGAGKASQAYESLIAGIAFLEAQPAPEQTRLISWRTYLRLGAATYAADANSPDAAVEHLAWIAAHADVQEFSKRIPAVNVVQTNAAFCLRRFKDEHARDAFALAWLKAGPATNSCAVPFALEYAATLAADVPTAGRALAVLLDVEAEKYGPLAPADTFAAGFYSPSQHKENPSFTSRPMTARMLWCMSRAFSLLGQAAEASTTDLQMKDAFGDSPKAMEHAILLPR